MYISLQYFHLHVRHHISYYDYVLSLKMAFKAEKCCLLLIDKVLFRHNLHLCYFSVTFQHNGNALPKKPNVYCNTFYRT
jgi:hypothetical protein